MSSTVPTAVLSDPLFLSTSFWSALKERLKKGVTVRILKICENIYFPQGVVVRQKKTQKFLGVIPYAKMGSAKKSQKYFFCP